MELLGTHGAADVVANRFALVKVVVDATVAHDPRAPESAISGDVVGADDFIRHALGHILERQFDGLGGDDHRDAAFRGWVDNSVHGKLPEDGDVDLRRVSSHA